MLLPLSIRFAVCLALISGSGDVQAPPPAPEDQLKAAIVLSLLRYAEWPKTRGAAMLVGVDAQGQAVGRALEGKLVNNRPIHIVELHTEAAEASCCDAIYLASSRPEDLRTELAAAVRAHVLTIGESRNFLKMGGVLNLLMVDGRMSFEVDLDSLAQTGVSISSKILRFGQLHWRRGDGS